MFVSNNRSCLLGSSFFTCLRRQLASIKFPGVLDAAGSGGQGRAGKSAECGTTIFRGHAKTPREVGRSDQKTGEAQ